MFRPFRKINLTYRNVRRLRVIVGIFMRHGLYTLAERLHLHLLVPLPRRIKKKRLSEKKETLSLAERSRLAFEQLGPTFIKLGQLIASRPDLVPPDFSREFRRLLDEVPPFPFEEVKRLIESEFKLPLKEVFSSFEEIPIAAASIAQVHRATLFDGTSIVVKVQRPHIERIINTDIELMYIMARLIVRYVPESQIYDPVGIVSEFSRSILKEMDFTREASSMVKISQNFKGDSRVKIPNVFWEQTTAKVLTLEEVKGIRVDDTVALKAAGIDCGKVGELLMDIFFSQVFQFGLFHGDLHAGNIFVVGEEEIAYVDFGIVGRVSEEMSESLANVFAAIMKGDYKMLVENYLDMGLVTEEGTDISSFERDYRELLETYLTKPLKEARLGELLMEYTRIAAQYKVKLPVDLILLDKCIFELEGLVRQLDPDLNMLSTGQKYAAELLRLWLSPGRMAKEVGAFTREMDKTARVLPGQVRQLMKKLVNDKFTIDFVHIGLDNLIDEIDRSSNRLSLGLVISAIIIGSSLIMMTGKGPLFLGFPILGFAGFVVAGLFGFLLALVILRSGKF